MGRNSWYPLMPAGWQPSGNEEMSMGEEARQDELCAHAGEEDRPQPTPTIWVTKDGTRIPVKDMTDSHLVNTIRLLQRRASLMKLRSDWRDICDMGPEPNGDMAALDFDQAASHLMESQLEETTEQFLMRTVLPYPAMVAETEKRGLNLD